MNLQLGRMLNLSLVRLKKAFTTKKARYLTYQLNLRIPQVKISANRPYPQEKRYNHMLSTICEKSGINFIFHLPTQYKADNS